MRFLIAVVLSCVAVGAASAQCPDVGAAGSQAMETMPAMRTPVDLRALVIGNRTYQHTSVVEEAITDAALMSDALKAIDFRDANITRATDVGRGSMFSLVEKFACSVREGDLAVLYYSGHGIEINRENFLIGVDARTPPQRYPQQEFTALSPLIDVLLARKPSVLVVFLDSCRGNPFPQLFGGVKGPGEAPARMQILSPENVVLVFAASPGMPAFQLGIGQQAGKGSIFTRHLANAIKTLARPLKDKLQDAATRVRIDTDENQKPYVEQNIFSDIFIDRRAAPAAEIDREWKLAFNEADAPRTRATKLIMFLAKYPASDYEYFARRQLASNAAAYLSQTGLYSLIVYGREPSDSSAFGAGFARYLSGDEARVGLEPGGSPNSYRYLVDLPQSGWPEPQAWVSSWEDGGLTDARVSDMLAVTDQNPGAGLDIVVDWPGAATGNPHAKVTLAKVEEILSRLEEAGVARSSVQVSLNPVPDDSASQTITYSSRPKANVIMVDKSGALVALDPDGGRTFVIHEVSSQIETVRENY